MSHSSSSTKTWRRTIGALGRVRIPKTRVAKGSVGKRWAIGRVVAVAGIAIDRAKGYRLILIVVATGEQRLPPSVMESFPLGIETTAAVAKVLHFVRGIDRAIGAS